MNLKLFILANYLLFNSNLFASIETNNCKPIPIFQCESVQDKIGTCHIKYFYTPAKGSYANDTGFDFRIFYYALDNKTCRWKVVRMNSYMSGFLAYD